MLNKLIDIRSVNLQSVCFIEVYEVDMIFNIFSDQLSIKKEIILKSTIKLHQTKLFIDKYGFRFYVPDRKSVV